MQTRKKKNILPILESDPWSLLFEGTGNDENDPHIIKSVEDLENFRNYVSAGNDGAGKYFKLADEIDYIDLSKISNWEPIGIYIENDTLNSTPFKGTFDGNKKEIRGMNINKKGNPDKGYGEDGYGFFGYNAGTIKNLGVVDGTVNLYDIADEVGGIVGYNEGTIEYCYNTCDVSGRDRTGGIVGNNPGIVRICFSTGNINGSEGSAGGIAGDSRNKIENCYSIGNIKAQRYVGGVVGFNSAGTVENCYSYSDDEITGSEYVGGVTGVNNGNVIHCYYLKGKADIGMGNKKAEEGNIGAEPLDKEQFDTKSIFTDAGWDFDDIWIMSEKLGRPIFGKEIKNEEDVTPEDPDTDDPSNEDPKQDDPTDQDPPADETQPNNPPENTDSPGGSWQRPGILPLIPPTADTSSANEDEDVSSAAGAYEDSKLMDDLAYAGIGMLIPAAAVLAVIIRKRIKSSK